MSTLVSASIKGVVNLAGCSKRINPIKFGSVAGLAAGTEVLLAPASRHLFGVCGWLATSYYPSTRPLGGRYSPVSAFGC